MRLTLGPDEARPSEPVLAVFPVMPAAWHPSIQAEPFHTELPATIDPNVDGDDTLLGRIEWSDGEDGAVMVNGASVALPHTWSVEGDDGKWRAELTLSREDGRVRYQRLSGYCD